MRVIACVDEKNGMLFNHRRQSRDRALCEDVLRESRGKRLYMTAYSRGLFENADGVELLVSEDLLRQAGEGDVCFIEDSDISGCEERIREILLYRWNRHYPADTYFPPLVSEGEWELARREEFQGFSHETITKEVYRRRMGG